MVVVSAAGRVALTTVPPGNATAIGGESVTGAGNGSGVCADADIPTARRTALVT
jgi:hypothetical protein